VDTTIIGPTTFVLEIDTSLSDPTPNTADGLGARVLSVPAGVTAVVSNLTFMGGDINNPNGGAGILSFVHLPLTDCTIRNNDPNGNGGGVSIRGGNFTVSGSTFYNNTATTNGGGLWVDGQAMVDVSNCTFSGNVATGRGGGIANNNADLSITFSTITL